MNSNAKQLKQEKTFENVKAITTLRVKGGYEIIQPIRTDNITTYVSV